MRRGKGTRPCADIRRKRPDLWANYVLACYRTAVRENQPDLRAKLETTWPEVITDEVRDEYQTHETAGAV